MIIGKPHVHHQTVDFDLLDAGNVVHHPQYLVICERARSAALNDAGYPVAELWADGYALALVSNTSKYLKPATLGQKLVVITTSARAGRSTLGVRQTLVPASAFVSVPSAGYVEAIPAFSEKELIYTLDASLTCVKMNPLRAARFPGRLVDALAIPTGPVTAEA